jgi:hypothetical protein
LGKTKAEKELRKTVQSLLNTAKETLSKELLAIYEEDWVKNEKAVAWWKQKAKDLLAAIGFKAVFNSLFEDAQKPIAFAFEEAAVPAMEAASASASVAVESKLFDLVHEGALKFARQRAAEMVGKKWVNGALVDNPNPVWSISDATRDAIRGLIEKAYKDGMTPAELAKELQSSYAFSKQRARLIAKTETAKASVSGTIDGWSRSGVVDGKSSILSDDHESGEPCECEENAAQGAIPIDEDFQSGDDGPPFHPACNCTLVAEFLNEGNES